MATISQYAALADAVYDDDPRVNGWARIAFRPSGAGLLQAFQGTAFKRNNEVVFAFKGTSGGRDVVADAKLLVGMNTYQYGSAYEFVRDTVITHDSRVSLTGHSLGGAITQIVGNRRRLPFITFNAPGVGLISRNIGEVAATVGLGTTVMRGLGTIASAVIHPMQAARDVASVFHVVKGANFRLGKDIVGCTGVHYGRVIEIPYAGGALDVKAKHKMTSMIAAIDSSRWKNMNLEAATG